MLDRLAALRGGSNDYFTERKKGFGNRRTMRGCFYFVPRSFRRRFKRRGKFGQYAEAPNRAS
jgi:hypothetical protein